MQMIDRDQRRVSYLRLSVTDRCNLRCSYCMPPTGVTACRRDWQALVVPGSEIIARLRRLYALEELPSSRLCGPARPYRIPGAAGSLGVITPISDHFCHSCNRIRVTS